MSKSGHWYAVYIGVKQLIVAAAFIFLTFSVGKAIVNHYKV